MSLPSADLVVVLGEDGRVEAAGDPKHIEGNEPLARFVQRHRLGGKPSTANLAGGQGEDGVALEIPAFLISYKSSHPHPSLIADAADGTAEVEKPKGPERPSVVTQEGGGKRLIRDEQRAKGRVKAKVYWSYVVATGGVLALVFVLASFAGVEALRYLQNNYLGIWVQAIEDSNDDPTIDTLPDALIYLYSSLGVLAVIVVRVAALSLSALRGSRTIHDAMSSRVMKAPLSFFERTPIGRILNRFSSDVETIDQVGVSIT